jgi:hypothetical protein
MPAESTHDLIADLAIVVSELSIQVAELQKTVNALSKKAAKA